MKLVLPINSLNKARSVKYIRRWPKNTGKGWNYLYPSDFLHPFKFLKEVLGVTDKKIDADYVQSNINKDFGVDKKTYAAHVLEYLTNRKIWDTFFSKKENREKYKKAVKQSELKKDKVSPIIGKENQPDLFEEKKDSGKIKLNRSLMKRVWSIYNPQAKQAAQQDKEKIVTPADAVISVEEKKAPELNGGKGNAFKFSDLTAREKTKAGKKIQGSVVSEIGKDTVPYNKNQSVADLAKEWIHNNPQGNAATFIGEVIINDRSVSRDMHHGAKGDSYLKLQTLPSVKDVLEKGTYLGYEEDYDGKPIDNHYFAGKIKYGDEEKIIFCRVRENAGDKNRFYVHEVFTEDEIKKEAALRTSNPSSLRLTGKPLYQFILQNVLNVNGIVSKNEAEEHENRRNAMLGNQNARKYGLSNGDIAILDRFFDNYLSYTSYDPDDKSRDNIADLKQMVNEVLREGGSDIAYFFGKLSTSQIYDMIPVLYRDWLKEQEAGNEIGDERDGLSSGSEDLRDGWSQGNSGENVHSAGERADGKEFVQQPRDSGVGLGGPEPEYRQSTGRVTKGKAKAIRQQCRELLESKKDSQMTEADKELLRQYEGAGGLGEGDQTSAAVLSEFYTPRDVIAKVWELVDKYKPIKKKVLEPSSGIGRFAEGKSENFTLCELDETSARIAGILHPQAKVKQGAFQNLFMKNNSVQKNYAGEKYDVAVGNPPYGEYSGIYKGMGEGKIHTRYEEYFIDRTLDTLEDGGILAFVVPSGFLRGKNSKAKQAIAAKGKLMEAWRLPKGTFSSTDVGTDIIIVKKGKGDIKDFTDNRYFVENESHVIGHETDGGNWGTKIINLPEGKTVAEAIQMIDVSAVNVENEVKEAVQKIESVAPREIKKNFAVIGNVAVGARIKTKDGKDGEIIGVSDKGMISYKVDGGLFGRLPMTDFEVFTDTKIEAELHQIRSEAMKGNQNAKKAFHKERGKKAAKGDVFTPSIGDNMSADSFNKLYSKSIPAEDIKFWRATEWDGTINESKLSDAEKNELRQNERFVETENGFVSVANYASGNIYDKLNALERQKEKLSPQEYERKKDILENALPAKKNVDSFTVSPISNFAKTFEIYGQTLVERFLKYCGFSSYGFVDESKSPISQYELEEYVQMKDVWDYINQVPVRTNRARREEDKESERMIAEKKRQNRKDTAERLFNDWLRKLPAGETREIEEAWNKKFNAFVNPDFSQIPLYVEGMNTHKGSKEFVMTNQQIKGASELCNKGNGILAYDVGVGKTVTGIVATVSQVQTGQSKRPLICVPKAVYKKWIKEFKQHFPNEPINELGNFSEKDLGKFRDSNGNIDLPERTVNICTYEALQKITFKPETISGELRDDIMDSQSVHDYDENGNLVEDTRTEREKAKQEEKILEMLGQSSKAKNGAVLWEDLGIDHLTVDELHNFKNIFSIPRSYGKSQRLTQEKKRDVWGRVRQEDQEKQVANEFSGITGATSSRGMKLFAISQLIQRENNGRGFFGLSATPFNNSPVEIYNILSLVARNRLKDLGIYNLQDFMIEFAELKNDWKVKANGDVESAQVMKNFKNLGALQSLITEFIDKVDGEEAGVIRPYKRVHKPELDLTPLQKAVIKAETDRMNGAFRKGSAKNDSADTLIAMNNMRMATLSPALIDPKFWADYEGYEGWHKPELKNIVKESPKLTFVCDTATNQYKARPSEGQVIYMPRGVEQYNYVKEYLVKKGIPAEAIAFMGSSLSLEKKEAITDSFNDPDGKIKIIIGSETIKEGVSLNGNSSTIYNTMLGWNPTETIQVEGRIWRQGNKQGVTHVVYPLMNDSIDAMMYQKYDEKSSRLNALWSYKGDSLNVEDINPEELKFELIKDPAKRASMRINQQQAELKRSLKMVNAQYDNIGMVARDYNMAMKNIAAHEKRYNDEEKNLQEAKNLYKDAQKDLKDAEKALKANPDDRHLSAEKESAARSLERMERKVQYAKNDVQHARNILRDTQNTIEVTKKQLDRLGISSPDKAEEKLKQLSDQRVSIQAEIDGIEKKRDEYIQEARSQIEAEQQSQRHFTVQDRVEHYTAEIAGDLRPFAGVKSGIQQLRELGKTQIEQVISDIRQNGSARVGDDVFTTKDLRDLQQYANKAVKKSLYIIDGRFYIV